MIQKIKFLIQSIHPITLDHIIGLANRHAAVAAESPIVLVVVEIVVETAVAAVVVEEIAAAAAAAAVGTVAVPVDASWAPVPSVDAAEEETERTDLVVAAAETVVEIAVAAVADVADAVDVANETDLEEATPHDDDLLDQTPVLVVDVAAVAAVVDTTADPLVGHGTHDLDRRQAPPLLRHAQMPHVRLIANDYDPESDDDATNDDGGRDRANESENVSANVSENESASARNEYDDDCCYHCCCHYHWLGAHDVTNVRASENECASENDDNDDHLPTGNRHRHQTNQGCRRQALAQDRQRSQEVVVAATDWAKGLADSEDHPSHSENPCRKDQDQAACLGGHSWDHVTLGKGPDRSGHSEVPVNIQTNPLKSQPAGTSKKSCKRKKIPACDLRPSWDRLLEGQGQDPSSCCYHQVHPSDRSWVRGHHDQVDWR
jgi:hypothetical protein